MRPLTFASILIFAVGCIKTTEPGPPAPHAATPVSASFGKTWDAVIDVFAVKNIPIRTLERVSGLIAAEPTNVERVELGKQHPWADCGTVAGLYGAGEEVPRQPTSAYYNVRVKGDSSRSTLLVTVRWKHDPPGDDPVIDCNTKSVWESQVEADIKESAEGGRTVSRNAQPEPSRGNRPIRSEAQRAVAIAQVAPRSDARAAIGAPSTESDRVEAVKVFVRAESYLGSHEWAKAERSLRYALQLDGSVAEYHASLGSLMMTLKRWDEAEAEFAAALLIDVDNPEYRRLLKSARSKR